MNLTKKLSALSLALTLFILTVTMVLASGPARPAHGEPAPDTGPGHSHGNETASENHYFQVLAPEGPLNTSAVCTGGTAPAVEGITLTECYQRNFSVGGNARTIRVWYTTDTATYTVDDVDYVHGVSGESQASDVADAVVESWQAAFAHSAIGGNTAHEPYINGCSSVLNIQLRDGKGWSGIAYWASSGNCNIGIDAPMILNGVGTGDDGVIFHEVQHYVQYSYNDGCYADFQPLYTGLDYPGGNAWIEGWANLAGKNATNAATDADYSVSSYNSLNSYYDLSYTNLHAQYLIEQYGGNGAPSDPHFGVKAVYEHYRKCDQYDDIFVMDETIQALTSGAKNEHWAFVDFEAAYYAYPYANPTTQPELVFPDADDKPTGTPSFTQNVNMGGGTQSWVDSSPELYTGKYYRINPQAGCGFLELHVETQPPGGEIGINFMAVNTGTPSVQRSAHIGDNATRFFAGSPAHNQIVVNVASFETPMTYQVSATCVTPTLNILEPVHNPGHAMVGAPDNPIATLTRFEVFSSGLPVSGIVPSTITFDAEGDAATLVPDSFQEVGPGQYWAAILPPTKPAGTTFVDYEVCLNTTICDTEADALLYVDPGNVDIVHVYDESGSMATEDTPGEGKRIDNAKKAGLVLADLLKDGDRFGIIGHGALDNPAGCGLPGGTGNCANGDITRLARINNVSVPGDIAVAKAAINTVTDRVVWTNTGQGLLDAKDMLLANPGNTNPDHIILLSDGQQNANPLYNDPPGSVKNTLQAAGVCVDTIGLGPEAPGALLAQIAANHCGTYMPVPTSGLGTSVTTQAAEETTSSSLMAMGAPQELADAVASVASADYYPGQLGIANANEYIDVSAQDSTRIFHFIHRSVPTANWSTHNAVIDKSVKSFQFLAAGKQNDGQGVRLVELLPPGEKRWIPVSPPVGATPADWDIRNDPYQDVVIVKEPTPGVWGYRVRYAEIPGDYIMNLSVDSPVRLQGNLLNLQNGMANAGDVVPIVATLMSGKGLIPGAVVAAAISNEGGTDTTLLLDDGNNHDGAAGDGIYGFPYSLTQHGGSYAVRVVALLPNPANPSETLFREWNGGFWVDGPQEGEKYPGDSDGDGMPDDWEKRCGLIVGQNDARGDKDRDGLINIRELENGTLPCRPDTDMGGEMDGSEVEGGRNPRWPDDDKAFAISGITLRPLNQRIAIGWSQRPDTHTNVVLCLSEAAGKLGDCRDIGKKGDFLLTGLANGKTYYITLYGEGEDGAQGDYSEQLPVKPMADPIPPQGAFFIGGPNVAQGGDVAKSARVTLFVDAIDTDSEFNGPAGLGSHSVPHGLVGPQFKGMFEVSGNVEMRFANEFEEIESAKWEPLASTKSWMLGCQTGEMCSVFGQFRDGAGNESLVVDQQIFLEAGSPTIYLPVVSRNP